MINNIKKYLTNISVFDFILLTILSLIGIVFFFFFYRKSEYISVRVKVTDRDILYENVKPSSMYSKYFVVGDVERNSLGNIISEITNVDKYPYSYGKSIVYVDLMVKATYDSRTQTYSSRGQKMLYGAPTRFTLSNITFDGYVVNFPGIESNQDISNKTITLELKARNLEKDIVEAIKNISLTESYSNKKILTIKDIIIKPAEMVTFDSNGFTYLRTNPMLVDIKLNIDVQVKEIDGSYYLYDDILLAIGEPFSLNIDNISLNEIFLITAINEN